MNNNNKLQRLRIVNTRPLEQGQILSKAITEAGGISIDFPVLAIEPTGDDWLTELPNLNTVLHAIFISANAVEFFYTKLKQHGLRWPTTIQTTAIGKASAAALAKWGISVDHVPSSADSEHLLQLDALQAVEGQSILLIKGEGGRPEIINTLLVRGATLVSLDVYRRVLPSTPQKTHSLWHDNAVDIILFTSQQAIHNLFVLLGKDAHPWICQTPCLVISERLAKEASRMGMQTIIISQYDTIVSTLEHYNQGLVHDKQ